MSENEIKTLATLFGLNVRSIGTGEGAAYQLGEREGGAGSYGLDLVVSYQAWNDRWSGRGGLTLPADKVALYIAEWKKSPNAHPDELAHRVGLSRYTER